MKNMKRLSSVFYMYFGAGASVFAVLCMFLPCVSVDGTIKQAAACFWNSGAGNIQGAWMTFIGFMFVLVSALMLFILALPFVQPTAKQEKVILISSLCLLFIGGLLVTLLPVFYQILNPVKVSGIIPYPGLYIFLFLDLVSIACSVMALKLDW